MKRRISGCHIYFFQLVEDFALCVAVLCYALMGLIISKCILFCNCLNACYYKIDFTDYSHLSNLNIGCMVTTALCSCCSTKFIPLYWLPVTILQACITFLLNLTGRVAA